jgi:hypothetical protein
MTRDDRNPLTAMLFLTRLEAFAGFVREARELAELPRGFAGGHGDGQRDIETAAATLHRDQKPRVGPVVDMVRHAGRFTAEEKYIPIRIGEIRIGQGSPGREKQQPAALSEPPLLEAVEIDVPCQGRHFEIVHAGPPEVAVGEVETGRLDDVDGDAEAGGEPQDGSRVAGNVGLVEGRCGRRPRG